MHKSWPSSQLTPNLATQLDRRDFSCEISHVYLQSIGFSVFSIFSIVKPISVCLVWMEAGSNLPAAKEISVNAAVAAV